ncbi:hypothetical protein BDV30DRAFT_217072 [Aspergillus minisclerotigenes]|uniref:Uncharacterized protein n=1 Tax=Aspergillus minisclerotigenes TaxID=656917 RepID=A0A5N6IRG1_9EURO|nr:hypothetical protein BDV30DRAFT_217072 [Aspergillus minisclerotigenes]
MSVVPTIHRDGARGEREPYRAHQRSFPPSSMQANHSRHRGDNRKGQEQRPIVIAKWLTVWGVFARPNELNA